MKRIKKEWKIILTITVLLIIITILIILNLPPETAMKLAIKYG